VKYRDIESMTIRISDRLKELGIESYYYKSQRGVPCITVDKYYGVCYFGRYKFFRIFLHGEKLCDIKIEDDVIDFFKNGEYKTFVKKTEKKDKENEKEI